MNNVYPKVLWDARISDKLPHCSTFSTCNKAKKASKPKLQCPPALAGFI